MVCMADTKTVMKFVNQLKEQGGDFKVEENYKAGTVRVWDGKVCVYSGIQKGPGQSWIVRYQDSKRVHFGEAVKA